MKKISLILILVILSIGCKQSNKENPEQGISSYVGVKTKSNIKIVGEMRNVMWKGMLDGRIKLDTISEKEGLYGLGPIAYLRGEILLLDGTTYVSRVQENGKAMVEIYPQVTAPFFVYGNQVEWKTETLSDNIIDLENLEEYITSQALNIEKPFVFKIKALVNNAVYHIQNLPKGSVVSNPKEAHMGQEIYTLSNTEVIIVGFYSKNHHGVFTHHDTNMHLHIITSDKSQMGHLDKLELRKGTAKLYLPNDI